MPRLKFLITIKAKSFLPYFFHLCWWQPLQGQLKLGVQIDIRSWSKNWRLRQLKWRRSLNFLATYQILFLNISQIKGLIKILWMKHFHRQPDFIFKATKKATQFMVLWQIPNSVRESFKLPLVVYHITCLLQPCQCLHRILIGKRTKSC